MSYSIEVRAADEATLIFTRTEHADAPWQGRNTTILVPAEQLASLVRTLQARLAEVEALQAATPVFTTGQRVRISDGHRLGQLGTVIEVAQKRERMQRLTGERWTYTVHFDDDLTWAYNAADLEPVSADSVGAAARARA